MKSATACARLQAQSQVLWPGAVVECTEYGEFFIRRGPTAGTWRGWPSWRKELVLSADYAEAKIMLAGKLRACRPGP